MTENSSFWSRKRAQRRQTNSVIPAGPPPPACSTVAEIRNPQSPTQGDEATFSGEYLIIGFYKKVEINYPHINANRVERCTKQLSNVQRHVSTLKILEECLICSHSYKNPLPRPLDLKQELLLVAGHLRHSV